MIQLSSIDAKKERHEEECLDAAIQLSKSKRAMTRNIMRMLSGATVNRDKNDRPDIIRLWHSNKPDEPDMYIGIEHFLVDQVTKTKGKKLKSVGAEYRSHIQQTYEVGHAAIENGQEIPEENREKLATDVFKLAAATNESGYDELLQALKNSLRPHAERAAAYRQEIQKYAGNHPIKLALLVEIRCYFPHLFLNNGRSVQPNTDCLMPMFREVVDELEKVDGSLVNYIVLYITNTVDKSKTTVIAVEAGRVTQCLRSQSIPIYEYCGTDVDLHYTTPQCIKTDDGNYKFGYSITHAPDAARMDKYVPALKAAYTARHEGKPFAASRNIQSYLYAFGGKIEFATDPNDDLLFSVNDTDQEEILRRFDEFTAKYPVGAKEHEQIG